MSARASVVARGPLAIGDLLPAIQLVRADDGGPLDWRSPVGGASAVVFVHSAECAGCRDYLATLAARMEEFRLWAGRPLVVVPGAERAAERLAVADSLPFPVIADPGDQVRGRCGAAPGSAAVYIADRWGQVYDITSAGTGHDLPTADELEEWFRYLSTQCPECGVPDEPLRQE